MKTIAIFFCLITTHVIQAQPVTQTPESKSLNLKERFQEMKAGAQTYTEYKVIREYQLDRTWKIISDSLDENRATIRSSKAEITRLQNEITSKDSVWKEKEQTYNELEYNGTHLTFLGISFGKKTFVTIFLFIIGGLLVLMGLLVMRLKSVAMTEKEKSDLMGRLTSEFEEYKHKALEKQMKLSRELQNERNRLAELKKP